MKSLGIIITLALVGDVIANALDVPIPGAALGMLILAGFFAYKGGPDTEFGGLFELVSPYFPIFFVPAAVGVIASLDIMATSWLYLTTAIVIGTGITIAITGSIAEWLIRRTTNL